MKDVACLMIHKNFPLQANQVENVIQDEANIIGLSISSSPSSITPDKVNNKKYKNARMSYSALLTCINMI